MKFDLGPLYEHCYSLNLYIYAFNIFIFYPNMIGHNLYCTISSNDKHYLKGLCNTTRSSIDLSLT